MKIVMDWTTDETLRAIMLVREADRELGNRLAEVLHRSKVAARYMLLRTPDRRRGACSIGKLELEEFVGAFDLRDLDGDR